MSWAEEWGNDEDYPTIVEKIVERRKDAVMQQRDKYEESIRSAERERIIALLEVEIEEFNNPMIATFADPQYLDGLIDAIALIKGETE